MDAERHSFDVEAASENGRRKSTRPPARRNTARTVTVKANYKLGACAGKKDTSMANKLTIEFDNVKPDGLAPRATALLLDKQTLSSRLNLVILQDAEQWCGDEWQDDGEGPISPSPVGGVKPFGGLWSSESRDDVWAGSEGVGETSIAERGRVRGDDIDRQDQAGEADGSEDLREV